MVEFFFNFLSAIAGAIAEKKNCLIATILVRENVSQFSNPIPI